MNPRETYECMNFEHFRIATITTIKEDWKSDVENKGGTGMRIESSSRNDLFLNFFVCLC